MPVLQRRLVPHARALQSAAPGTYAHDLIIMTYVDERTVSQAHCPTPPLPSVGVVLDDAVLDGERAPGEL